MLTEFEIIDDKVDSAIFMIYFSGQPIVFVGTGQTYTDLNSIYSYGMQKTEYYCSDSSFSRPWSLCS